ncbi:MAG: replication-relaxation family protein, partial [Solirubrobacterales bacterium]
MDERGVYQSLSAKGHEILASLAAHRVLSTPQVYAIHSPEVERRWVQKLLGRLRAAGLADYVLSAHGRRRLWFATERGTRLA